MIATPEGFRPYYRKGPLKVTLEFTEIAPPTGPMLYVCRTVFEGREYSVQRATTVEESAKLAGTTPETQHPYAFRAAVRANLAKELIVHLHKEDSCRS